jgi:hypothetical protein
MRGRRLIMLMLQCRAWKYACRLQLPRIWWVGGVLILYCCAGLVRGAVVSVRDEGAGNDYISGEPITLPAARLCTNLFHNGAQVIRNRLHTARAAVFDSSGRLDYMKGESDAVIARASGAGRINLPGNGVRAPVTKPSFKSRGDDPNAASATNGFPAYLEGQQYVWFLQDARHYTNYSCTVTVDCPSTFYLLVDNRVNDYLPGSEYDDPSFGPPDTQWVLDGGWKRVDTGLSPNSAGDYVGIDEGDNATINQVYAVYSRTLTNAGSIKLGTEFDGNIYCLVVSTNPFPSAKAVRQSDLKQTARR